MTINVKTMECSVQTAYEIIDDNYSLATPVVSPIRIVWINAGYQVAAYYFSEQKFMIAGC